MDPLGLQGLFLSWNHTAGIQFFVGLLGTSFLFWMELDWLVLTSWLCCLLKCDFEELLYFILLDIQWWYQSHEVIWKLSKIICVKQLVQLLALGLTLFLTLTLLFFAHHKGSWPTSMQQKTEKQRKSLISLLRCMCTQRSCNTWDSENRLAGRSFNTLFTGERKVGEGPWATLKGW